MSIRRAFCSTALAMGIAILAQPAVAEGPKIKPGRWETTVTTVISLMPTPRTNKHARCMTSEDVDPKKWMSEQAKDCKFSNVESSSTMLSFEMVCKTDQGVAKGKGVYRLSDPENATGKMEMSLEGPMAVEITNDITAKRVGDC